MIGEMKLNHEQIQLLGNEDAALDGSLETFVDQFSRLLSILVDLIDPSVVVLGGSLEVTNRTFFEALNERVMRQRVLRNCKELTVRPSAHGERGVSIGAAMLARAGGGA